MRQAAIALDPFPSALMCPAESWIGSDHSLIGRWCRSVRVAWGEPAFRELVLGTG